MTTRNILGAMQISDIEKIPDPFRGLPIKGCVLLAPMDGYTDYPFRLVCRDLGSTASITEFLDTNDIINRPAYIEKKIQFDESERPIIFQILGNDPEQIFISAEILLKWNPDAIDINLGCPSKNVCSRGAGSTLLKQPAKISQIIEGLVERIDLPITAKIRLGWDDRSINYLEVSKRIEQAGASLLAVHGRTRAQQYKGEVDLDAIAEIKKSIKIPVIANGNITSLSDINSACKLTNADGIMIGRAAIHNPWIFSGLDRVSVPNDLVWITLQNHLNLNIKYYGYEKGIVLFRKFAKSYLLDFAPSRYDMGIILSTLDHEILLSTCYQIIFQKP